jgi:hypothetical protein
LGGGLLFVAIYVPIVHTSNIEALDQRHHPSVLGTCSSGPSAPEFLDFNNSHPVEAQTPCLANNLKQRITSRNMISPSPQFAILHPAMRFSCFEAFGFGSP